MKRDFTALDAAMLAAVDSGHQTFAALYRHSEVRPTADACDPKRDGYRMIDRRLQAMRKAGKIKQQLRGVWVVA